MFKSRGASMNGSGLKNFFTVDVFVEKSTRINRKSIRKMSGPPLDSFTAVYFCCRRKCRRHLSTWRRSSRPFLSRFLGQMKYWVENTSSSFHFMHRNLLGYFFTSCGLTSDVGLIISLCLSFCGSPLEV